MFYDTLQILTEQGFTVKTDIIADKLLYLVHAVLPSINWTKENAIYRSSIWDEDGNPVSLSFKKFVNWGERPDIFPPPTSLNHTNIISKVDGSCLVISKFRDTLILRTRGTFNALTQVNGQELLWLQERYPLVFNNKLLNSEKYSILCEWTTPSNKIVIDYGNQPDLKLLNIIQHKEYRYLSQKEVDECAALWSIKRPERYTYHSVSQMLTDVPTWVGKEGICLYYNNDQDILKVKSLDYLRKHAFKSNITQKNIVELFMSWDRPNKDSMLKRIETEYDFECRKMSEECINTLYLKKDQIDHIINDVTAVVSPLKMDTRKNAAFDIVRRYKDNGLTGIAFTLLDGKPISDNDYKKLLLKES